MLDHNGSLRLNMLRNGMLNVVASFQLRWWNGEAGGPLLPSRRGHTVRSRPSQSCTGTLEERTA